MTKEYKDHNILAHKGYTDEYMLKESGDLRNLQGLLELTRGWLIMNTG